MISIIYLALTACLILMQLLDYLMKKGKLVVSPKLEKALRQLNWLVKLLRYIFALLKSLK